MSRITRRTVIPVNQVTPLTYRDGVTYIQMLSQLSEYVKGVLHPSLQHTVDQVVADVEAQMDIHHDQYVDGVQEFQRIHDAFMSDVNAHLVALNDDAVAELLDDGSSLAGGALRHVLARVDVRDYGARPGIDNTGPFNQAADDARRLNLPIFIPENSQPWEIRDTVNFRYLNIDAPGRITVTHTDAPGIIVGDHADQRPGQKIYFADVRHAGTGYFDLDWDHPAIRVLGMMGAELTVKRCSFLEFYATADNREDRSIAYNSVYLQRVQYLRLHTETTGSWVNENIFIGGDYNRIRIDGRYPNDQNVFIKPSVEGSHALIEIEDGHSNVFQDVRAEGGTNVYLGERATMNTLSGLYLDNYNVISPWSSTRITDHGEQNVVTSRHLSERTYHSLFTMSPGSNIYGNSADWPYNSNTRLPYPPAGDGKLTSRGIAPAVFDSGIIPTRLQRGDNNLSLSPPSTIERLTFSSDAKVMMITVRAYDEHRELISPDRMPIRPYAGIVAGNSSFHSQTPLDGATMVLSHEVHYVSISISNAHSSGETFEYMTVGAYVVNGHSTAVIDTIRQRLHKPLFSTTQPTTGADRGTIVEGSSRYWVSTKLLNRSTAATANDDATRLLLDNAANVFTGDIIGVELADGRSFWTIVDTTNDQHVHLEAAVPGRVNADAPVKVCTWTEYSR